MTRPSLDEVSTLRLYLLRALYLLMFVGQATIQLPILINHGGTVSFWQGVGASMLAAMALLSALGLRYPLQMLPLLFFEFAWKFIWMIAVYLPRWSAGSVDAVTAEAAVEIMMGIIVPIIIPWRYVFANYVRRRGDRWRSAPTS